MTGKIKTLVGEELAVVQHGIVQQFLELLVRTNKSVKDDILKIELRKKGYED